MTPKQLGSVSPSANLDTRPVDLRKRKSPTCGGAALAFEREEEIWDASRHPVYFGELMHVLDYHRPKRQQAFDEVKRLLDCEQTKTEAFTEAVADLEWHNQACLAAVFQYGAELD